MQAAKLTISLIILAALAGCMDTRTNTVSKTSVSYGTVQTAQKTPSELRLEAQARSLDDMTREIIRASTIRGAGLGALAGCATAMISASGAQQCIGGAVAGGAIGAAIGKAHGEKQVAKRMAFVSRKDVAQSLSRASARLGSVRSGLAEVMAAQDAERRALRGKLAGGEITQEAFEARLAAMAETRRVVAEALTLTARQAKAAKANIASAQGKGQTDLEWHVEAADELEHEAISARSGISLL